MRYTIGSENPGSKFINVQFDLICESDIEIEFQLPAWRPGRYELGNFAKNLRNFCVVDENGNFLNWNKKTKDLWIVNTNSASKVKVTYEYYANELNAGSTWVDEKMLYVNPVNCLLYVPNKINQAVELDINFLPKESSVIISLPKLNSGVYLAKDFHELFDSPFVVGGKVQKLNYEVEGVPFNIWFIGECKPDNSKIVADFKSFTQQMFNEMGAFPFEEFHFINHILPFPAYHGVEHQKCTVITLGPGYQLMSDKGYNQLLGISSHELYHAWNVKNIRSVDLFPYDYSKENYSNMGYLCEGITTYLGDLFLVQSGIINTVEFYDLMHQNFNKHFFNYGRFNLSVANSSIDTWLDGYSLGAPNRKTSIYTEGALLTMCLDLMILEESSGNRSIHSMMKELFENFGQKGLGVSETDFNQMADKYTNNRFSAELKNYFYSSNDLFELINEKLQPLGLSITKSVNENYLSDKMGLILEPTSNRILKIALNSPAEQQGLNPGDEIIEINGISTTTDANEWANYFKESLSLMVIKDRNYSKLILIPEDSNFYPIVKIEVNKSCTNTQQGLRKIWLKG